MQWGWFPLVFPSPQPLLMSEANANIIQLTTRWLMRTKLLTTNWGGVDWHEPVQIRKGSYIRVMYSKTFEYQLHY